VTINAHRALYSAASKANYLGNLTVDDPDAAELRRVRDLVRETLVAGFRHWSQFIERRELFGDAALSFAETDALRPKFRMQGSWAYFTLNRTTVEPPQEIDLDDGMFLPISFLTRHGTTNPAIVSRSYFAAVEAMLAPLCREEGWALDDSKPSCVRVVVRDGAHVDIALYAIPDQDFSTLLEKAVMSSTSFGAVQLNDAEMFDAQIYPNLPDDHIMLAHRDDGWKPSDPRKLEDWFNAAIARHDQQLRRVCRYLKGWRDSRWNLCRLSSIALMSCVVTAFDEASAAVPANRDDLALRMVADALPRLLGGAIVNPVVDGQRLDEKWSDVDRADFVAGAEALRADMHKMLGAVFASTALATLRAALGKYIPDDVELVIVEEPEAPAVLTSGLLGDVGPEPEARQPVRIGGDQRYG